MKFGIGIVLSPGEGQKVVFIPDIDPEGDEMGSENVYAERVTGFWLSLKNNRQQVALWLINNAK
jgi:hypothetical protein